MEKQTVNIGANLDCFREIGLSAFFRGTLRDPKVALANAEKANLDFLLVSATKKMPAINETATPWTFWEKTEREGNLALSSIARSKVAEISWAMNSRMNFIDRKWRKNGLVRMPASEIADPILLSMYLRCDYPNAVVDSYELLTAAASKETIVETMQQLEPMLSPVFILNLRAIEENCELNHPQFFILNEWAKITSDFPERWIIVENVTKRTTLEETIGEFARLKAWIHQVTKTE